jgi:hypothetical protein
MTNEELVTYMVKEIQTAIKQFGEHEYGDKGAHEVMDIEFIAKRLLEGVEDSADYANILYEVSKTPELYVEPFMSSIIEELEGHLDSNEWDELMSAHNESLSEYY